MEVGELYYIITTLSSNYEHSNEALKYTVPEWKCINKLCICAYMLDYRRVIQIHSDIINVVAVPPTGMLQKVDLTSLLFL